VGRNQSVPHRSASSFDRCGTGIAWAWKGASINLVRLPREGSDALAAQSSPVSRIVFVVAVLATSIVLVAALA